MGRKIPFDEAKRLAGIENNASIYCKTNRYGYQINVNHPKIRPLYETFKKKCNTPILSDAQRLEFERIIFLMIERSQACTTESS